MLIVKSDCEEKTRMIGKILGEKAMAGMVVALNGELGAGKTVFAQGVAEGLAVVEMVTSPTYVLMNVYQGRLVFYHFDFYRLDEEEELADLGLEEYFYGEGLTLVEWAEKFTSSLPKKRLELHIVKDEQDLENSRILSFRSFGEPPEGSEGFGPVMEALRKCFC